jgi:uncharacterized surface protein with fasciclin (FAS1) repeats
MLVSLAMATALATPALADDLLQVATANGNLGMFMQLVRASSYAEMLKTGGPFTIFAPSDNFGFMEIEDSSLFGVLEVDPEQREKSSDLNFRTLPTALPGATLTTVRRPDGRIQVLGQHQGGPRPNGGHILDADIEASNGVIHVINSIILPPQQRAF